MIEFTSTYWNDRAAEAWAIHEGMKTSAARDAMRQVAVGYSSLAQAAEKRERLERKDITADRLRSETGADGEGGSRRMGLRF